MKSIILAIFCSILLPALSHAEEPGLTCVVHPYVKLDDELTSRSLVEDPQAGALGELANLKIETTQVGSWQECFQAALKTAKEWKQNFGLDCAMGSVTRKTMGGFGTKYVRTNMYLSWEVNDGTLWNSAGQVNCLTKSQEPRTGDLREGI